ncbi:PQQ-binding-like beta-propeller repeat protein [Candidatus Bathyarchaeota archaeon A05DMB-2]|nr:PQQ-binding-like beta-propeller repeat protein [Candidatus Bathyarchaeota archaeon A05DMB-2]
MRKNKTTAAIAIFLIMTFAVSLVALPTVNAAPTCKTYPIIGATPNPVGVGQETLIMIGITQATTSALYGWEGLTITITKPDGTIEKLDNDGKGYTTDSTGLTGVVYVPSVAGNYTLQMHFPEQVCEEGVSSFFGYSIAPNTTMLGSDSEKITLVVQDEPIQYYPGFPLPTEFWTRPIDMQLREWAPIAGNWLTTPRNFYAVGNEEAPETAHILWAKPLTSGGLVGGALNAYDGSEEAVTQIGYEHGDAYEGKWSGSIIMAGKLYYQKYASADPYKEVACVDLHTGKELWSRVLLNNLTLTRGQMHYWQTYDNQGVYDYLWATGNNATASLLGINLTKINPGTIWCAFDPFNGDFVYALYGIPSGTFAYGPKGELLIYTFDLRNGWMTLWNSTNIPALYASTLLPSGQYTVAYLSMAWGQWRPMGKVVNATGPAGVTKEGAAFVPPTAPLNLNGYSWNKTIQQKGLPGSVRAVFPQDKILGGVVNQTHVVSWGISLKPGDEGRVMYNTVWQAPSEWLEGNLTVSLGAISNIDNVFTVNTKEDRMRYGFSTLTGEYLWKISEPIAMLGHLTGGPSGENGYIAYGLLYCGTMSGVIQAFNVTNGKLVWKYEVRDPYMQVLWSNNWPVGHLIVTDGKVYIANLEHSVNQPLPRGGPFVCLNATTGEVIWRANGLFRQTVWGGRAVIGDSIIATMDTYDQRIYAIGKGPSATTVTAPDIGVQAGSVVMIKGTVTDVSPGTEEYGLRARFPNGVPAVSDECMSDWMLYVYKQFPRPSNASGVEVSIDAIDPNNNFIHLGTATSDSSGTFGFAWETPNIPGKYTIIATFGGSKAYYASFAETYAYVTEAPSETPAPTPTPASVADLYFVPATVGTIVAIAVVGALLALLLLRKRP